MYDNYRFLSDPVFYLEQQAVSCYLQQGDQYNKDMANAGVSSSSISVGPALAFDIVDGRMQAVKELRVSGRADMPGGNQYNPKIIGNWIPYLGQPKLSDYTAFGRIKLQNAPSDYIFTYHMNGCQLVVVKGKDSFTYLFHEPTSSDWKTRPDYSAIGTVSYETSPSYEHHGNPYGIACGLVFLRRWFGKWFVIVQTIGGDGKVLEVREDRLPE